MLQRLSGMQRIVPVKPQGAFYVFCNISKTKLDALTFATRVLDEASVALIPGDGFGRPDYVRLSFATSIFRDRKRFK